MKKFILIGSLVVLALGGFLFSQQKINGIHTAFMSKESIKKELETVPKTTVSYENQDIDVTDTIFYSALDFNKKLFSQTVIVEKTVDKDKLSESLSSIKLDEFYYFDIDKVVSKLNYGKETDISDCLCQEYSDKVIKKYNKLKRWSCKYTKKIKFPSIMKYVELKSYNKIKVDYSFIDKYLDLIEKRYNTFGDPVKFTTHTGKKITLDTPSSMWGDIVDRDAEYEYLKKSIESLKSIKNREPVFTQKTGKLGNDYIEVDITNQTVYYVRNGKVQMQSSCVTGTAGSHDTPKGVYYILERRAGKWLTGANYRTWVDRWLRVTWTGIGLHDASWRGSFGGNIYRYSGSHGCVNLPYSFIIKLYDKVEWGYPVVIH